MWRNKPEQKPYTSHISRSDHNDNCSGRNLPNFTKLQYISMYGDSTTEQSRINREKQFIIGRSELINNSLDNISKSPSNLCFRLHAINILNLQ